MIQLEKKSIDITSHDLLTLGKYKNYGPKIGHNITLNHSSHNNLCLDYSEYPEKLKELLKELIIKVEIIGPIKSKWHDDRKLLSLEMLVTIKRGSQEISFSYYGSNNDAMLFIKPDSDNMREFGQWLNTRRSIDLFPAKIMRVQARKRFEFLKGLKYSILACCSCDYFINIDFDEFCADFGYDNDSMKANQIHKDCLKQSAKLQRIFRGNEVEVLPC